MKIKNKFLLTSGSLATMALPIVTVIACGNPEALIDTELKKVGNLASTKGFKDFANVFSKKGTETEITKADFADLGVNFTTAWGLLSADKFTFHLTKSWEEVAKNPTSIDFKVTLEVSDGAKKSKTITISLVDTAAPTLTIKNTKDKDEIDGKLAVQDSKDKNKYVLTLPSASTATQKGENGIEDLFVVEDAYDGYGDKGKNPEPTFVWKDSEGTTIDTTKTALNFKEEGTYTLEVSAKDKAGNAAASLTLEVKIGKDTVAPKIAIKEGEAGKVGTNAVTITEADKKGTLSLLTETEASKQISDETIEGIFEATDTVDKSPKLEFAWKDKDGVDGVAQPFNHGVAGTYVLIVTATDNASTKNESKFILTVKVADTDETAPVISIDSTKNANVGIDGNNKLTINAKSELTPNDIEGVFVANEAIKENGWTYTWKDSLGDGVTIVEADKDKKLALADGTYTLSVQAEDTSGNKVDAADAFKVTITIDRTPPTLVLNVNPTTGVVAGKTENTLLINDVKKDTKVEQLIGDFTSDNGVITVEEVENTSLLATSKLSELGVGDHTLSVVATDDAGNKTTYALKVTVDVKGPEFNLNGSNTLGVTNESTFTINDDNKGKNTTSIVSDIKGTFSVTEGTVTIPTMPNGVTEGQVLPEGTHVFILSATDENNNTTTHTFTVKVDTVKPNAAIASTTSGKILDITTDQDGNKLTIDYNSALTLQNLIDGFDYEAGTELVITSDDFDSGDIVNKDQTVQQLGFGEGTYTLKIIVVDKAGNKSEPYILVLDVTSVEGGSDAGTGDE